MKIHLIAIGGSAMHNMALALHDKGFEVTGSDDQIFEPSRGRLKSKGLLPEADGWFPEKITNDIDAIILGMHARPDNPELKRAQELGLNIYSYPEYLYEQSKDKKRVVIGGSHGKTSITSMILHVLNQLEIDADYMVGAQLKGFDNMVKLTKEAEVIILEGDEYLSSPIDRRPKFHWYKPHVAVLSGIAWDHINVFPTFDNYVEQFSIFMNKMESGADLYYYEGDAVLKTAVEKSNAEINKAGYTAFDNRVEEGVTYLKFENKEYPIQIFGSHNLQNLSAAFHVCVSLGIEPIDFIQSIQSFEGAAKRLEKVAESKTSIGFKDFAHSPSKLKATTQAVKNQFPNRKLIACMELHTFSSLNAEFLKEYNGCMDAPDEAIVYFSPKAIAHKKLAPISEEQVFQSFNRRDLKVFTESQALQDYLNQKRWEDANLLVMTSGNFDGIDLDNYIKQLIGG
jgi:UDP-N-acetylmuramate: L-alanyl-gamma-D-glutamyl-meso-diaminopimelate ligase